MKKLRTYCMVGWGLWGMATVFCMMGCSDDGEEGLPGTEGGNPEEEEYLNADSMNYERVKSNLFVADTLSPGAVKYTPRNGEVLDNAFPDVYSIGVDSVEEALSFFNTNCVPIGEEDKVASEDGALVYDLGDYGRLVYREGDGRDETASIDVRLSGVDDMSRISFIPMSQWPNNEESPFWVGDVVVDKYKTGSDKWWWICVRACEGGKPGILMTCDGGWTSTRREDHYKHYYKYTGCASLEAWNALAQFYYSNPVAFKAEYEELKRIGASAYMLKQVLYDLYTNTVHEYVVGNMWDTEHWWWAKARHVWKASMDYVTVSPGSIVIKNGMPVFEFGNEGIDKKNNFSVVARYRTHHVTFTSWDGSADKYTRMYPEY